MPIDCGAGICCFPFCCFPCAWFFPCIVKGAAAGGGGAGAAAGCPFCCAGMEHAPCAHCCAAEHACCACLTETFCAPCLRLPCCAPCFAAERACCGAVAGAAMVPNATRMCQEHQHREVVAVNKYMPYEEEEELKFDVDLAKYYGKVNDGHSKIE